MKHCLEGEQKENNRDMLWSCRSCGHAGFRFRTPPASAIPSRSPRSRCSEAAALAIKAFRGAEWMDAGPGVGAVLDVSVLKPVAKHQIPLRNLTAWLEPNGRTPKEQATKQRLRALLGER